MIFDKVGNTTIILQEKASLKTFIKKIHEAYETIQHDHIIVNLFSFSDLTQNDVLEFLELSNTHRKAKKSFVLVTEKVTYDEVPEAMVVVPTLQEAKDIIEMEEIERDLGL